MEFFPLYLILMLIQFARKRVQSSKALGVGFAIGAVHAAIFWKVDFNNYEPVLFYACMFLLSFGWFHILDWLDLKVSTIFCGFLVALQIVMVFNCINNDVTNTILYGIYPIVITIINVLMIGSGLEESDDMATGSANADCHIQGHTKGEGAIKWA